MLRPAPGKGHSHGLQELNPLAHSALVSSLEILGSHALVVIVVSSLVWNLHLSTRLGRSNANQFSQPARHMDTGFVLPYTAASKIRPNVAFVQPSHTPDKPQPVVMFNSSWANRLKLGFSHYPRADRHT